MYIRNGVWVISTKDNAGKAKKTENTASQEADRTGEAEGNKAKKRKLRAGVSLHVRLFLLLLIAGIVPVIAFNQIMYRTYMKAVVSNTSQNMAAQAMILGNQIVKDGYLDGGYSSVDEALTDQMADCWEGRIRIVDSSYRILKDTYGTDEGKYCVDEAVLRAFSGEHTDSYNEESHSLYLVEPIMSSDSEPAVVGAIIFNADMMNIEQPILGEQEEAWMLMCVIFCILFLCCLVLLHSLLRPLKMLAVSISQTVEGSNNTRVNVRSYKETARISDAFNLTWDRMQAMDQSRQEFVSNVAHELKTPITSVRVLADSLTSMGGEAPLELYQDFMTDISSELDRESKIIDDLLSLSRLERASDSLNLARINVNEMMELLLKRLVPIGKTRNIELKFESFRPVIADVDEVKLSLAITNLVENGIKYNKDGGEVLVSLNADYQYFFIKVKDTGCGIPADALDHIFERFYRVDKARSRDTGGTGLGLPIAKSIISLHHGAVKAYSKVGEGTTFVVRIPLKYVEE